MILPNVFLTLLWASSAAFLAAFLLGVRRRPAAVGCRDALPAVSIIKPLCGADEALEENLESFFQLDYPEYEVVFSFARADDPALPAARRAADRHRHVRATFVIDRREPVANPKVNRLLVAVPRARHRLLLFSDGNVRVRPDFLRRAVGPFADPRVGLLSHLFRGSGARSFASRLECLHLNGVLQAGTAALSAAGQPCVVGKSILVTREALDAIGGLRAVGDHLAEDFMLGTLVRRAGYRVCLSDDVIDTAEISKGLRAVWNRHRRWALMRRRLGGWGYLAESLSSPLPWFAGSLLFGEAAPEVVSAAAGLLAARYLAEGAMAAFRGQRLEWRDYALLPVRDVLVAAIFWSGLVGQTTTWRGHRVRLGPMTRIVAARGGSGSVPLAAAHATAE